ncbi:hypothetical protein DF186_20975, partial [Enterococcus hirae]
HPAFEGWCLGLSQPDLPYDQRQGGEKGGPRQYEEKGQCPYIGFETQRQRVARIETAGKQHQQVTDIDSQTGESFQTSAGSNQY